MTEKHTKILAMAATATGASPEIYYNEIKDLVAAGKIEMRETFSNAGGNRKLRYFLKAA